MCIDLYVDKVLVYTDCVPSPEPSLAPGIIPIILPSPSTVPDPSVPSPSLSVPSPESPSPEPSVPSPVPSPYAMNNTPSSIPSPETNVIIDGYSLMTPSSIPITNTMNSPSSSNSSNMSIANNGSKFIHTEQGWISIVIVIAATVLPALFICILVYKKKPRKCKNSNKVQPEHLKKKQCCKCCKKEPRLPVKQDRSTTTGTYLNQPPLPLSPPPTSR